MDTAALAWRHCGYVTGDGSGVAGVAAATPVLNVVGH